MPFETILLSTLLLSVCIVLILQITVKRKIELREGENKSFEVGARYHGIGTGGRIVVTNQRIIFQPGIFSFFGKTIDIPFDNIDEIDQIEKAPIIMITCKSGIEHKFYVLGAEKIKKSIIKMIPHLKYS